MVEIIEYNFENNGITLNVSYLFDGDDRSMRVDKCVKNYIIKTYKHNGISETNYLDFVTRKDPKYKIEDYHVTSFLLWYHNK